jgi:hypothetical protein
MSVKFYTKSNRCLVAPILRNTIEILLHGRNQYDKIYLYKNTNSSIDAVVTVEMSAIVLYEQIC